MKKNTKIAIYALSFFTTFTIVSAEIKITEIGTSTARVSWNTATEALTSPLYFGQSPHTYSSSSNKQCNGEIIGLYPTIEHCIVLSNLTPDTSYYVHDPSVTGVTTNEFNFKTASLPLTLKEPTLPEPVQFINTENTAANPYMINISWRISESNQTRFEITRYQTGGTSVIVSTQILPTTTNYTDIVPTYATYRYSIRACNLTGCSNYISDDIVVENNQTTTVTQPTTTTYGEASTTQTVAATTTNLATVIQLSFVSTNPCLTCEVAASYETASPTKIVTAPFDISKAFGLVLPGAFVSINSKSSTFSARAFQDGTFSIQLPDDLYTVEAQTQSNNNDVTKRTIEVVSGKITTNEVISAPLRKKINGKVTLPSTVAVYNAEVSAYRNDTGQRIVTYTNTEGKYELTLSQGIWNLAVRPKYPAISSDWQPSEVVQVIMSSDNLDETKEQNFTVNPNTSDLKVIVVDEHGNAIENIGVVIDTVSIKQYKNSNGVRQSLTQKTSQEGTVSLHVSPNTYYIRTAFGDSMSYTDSDEQSLVLMSGQARSIQIVLKNQVKTNEILFTGVTKFDDGSTVSAYVTAWSSEGDHKEMRTDNSGLFSLSLTEGHTWHIRGVKDYQGKTYSSDEQTIKVSEQEKSIEIIFVKADTVRLPSSVSIKNDATKVTSIVTDNGARFSLPANGVTDSGNINVEIKPTSEAPSHSVNTLISTAYDITLKNSAGQKISKLQKEAEILIPYSDKELASKGVLIESVIPSYYDELLNTWVSVPNFIINRDKKVFVLRVDHLTRFALIAAADTVAPESPTNVVTDAITPTDVLITWNNPSKDFDHSKIYRSETPGKFGKIVAAEVFSNSFIDKTSSSGKKIFYYTVRAVDAAGNESSNMDQLAVTTVGDSLAKGKTPTSLLLPPGQISTTEISRKLSLGSKGNDVLLLQKALKFDGFYVTGPLTGYYGKLTENAVFRFQNYYKKELLIPNGYTTGTGVVGEITRGKINEIIARSAQ